MIDIDSNEQEVLKVLNEVIIFSVLCVLNLDYNLIFFV